MIRKLHRWDVSPSEAVAIQRRLAGQVSRVNELGTPRLIAGADVSVQRATGVARAAVAVLDYPELGVVETQAARERLGFPYIPGLLSFRESPAVLAACERLAVTPDLVIIDGQGLAHPRRMGIACHLGLLLDRPTIGCAKSLLVGHCEEPPPEAGGFTEITDDGEVIGAAVRTRAGVSPVFVSVGHKIDLETAIRWVLNSCRGHRLPEPTRLAHLAAGGKLAATARPNEGTA